MMVKTVRDYAKTVRYKQILTHAPAAPTIRIQKETRASCNHDCGSQFLVLTRLIFNRVIYFGGEIDDICNTD